MNSTKPNLGELLARNYLKTVERRAEKSTREGLAFTAVVSAINAQGRVSVKEQGSTIASSEYYPRSTGNVQVGDYGVCVPTSSGLFFVRVGKTDDLVSVAGDGSASTAARSDHTHAPAGQTYSVVIGKSTESSENSVAIGQTTKALSGGAGAFGYFAQATHWYATAVGGMSKALFDHTTAVGSSANASGGNSTAMGREANAAGGNSIAIGPYASAAHNQSLAVGASVSTSQAYQGVVKADAVEIVPASRLFSKLGLRRADGTRVFLSVNNSNQLQITTSF